MTTTAPTVSPVHGGLTQPVNCIDANAAADTSLPRLEVSDVDVTTLYRIADGTLSPLNGPMGKADYDSVLAKGSIERSGKNWAWTIPIILPVTDAEAGNCTAGNKVGLWHGGKMIGTLTVDSCFDWDKSAFIKAVYRTERTDHPGARLWTADERSKIVGGAIALVPFSDGRSFAKRVMSPSATRPLIESKGWEQSIAFQTRNPLHRAHEYALVYGAETILRNGKQTGVILNPLVGQLKGDGRTRRRAHADLRSAGRGQVARRRRQGRRAVEEVRSGHRRLRRARRPGHAHVLRRSRRGRDARHLPPEPGLHPLHHRSQARRRAVRRQDCHLGGLRRPGSLRQLGGDLSIQTVNVGFAAFFEELDRVGLVAENKGNTAVMISGTKVREQLTGGQEPDPRIMRPSTAKILVDFYASKNA